MALTDGAILLMLAQIGMYFVMYKNKIRLWRMVGSCGMILIGISAVAIEDTIPAMVFMGASLIIGGVELFKDVASLVKG